MLWISWASDFQAWDAKFLDGLDVTLADASTADVVLLQGSQQLRTTPDVAEAVDTGVFETGEPNAELLAALGTCAERGLTMICANPDFTVTLPNGQCGYMPGCIARSYEQMLIESQSSGGSAAGVTYFGKPHRPAFDAALQLLSPSIDRSRVLHVGDSLLHDIAGANAAGVDSLFVAAGIHAEELGVPEVGSRAADGHESSSLTAPALQRVFGATGVTPTLTVEAFVW